MFLSAAGEGVIAWRLEMVNGMRARGDGWAEGKPDMEGSIVEGAPCDGTMLEGEEDDDRLLGSAVAEDDVVGLERGCGGGARYVCLQSCCAGDMRGCCSGGGVGLPAGLAREAAGTRVCCLFPSSCTASQHCGRQVTKMGPSRSHLPPGGGTLRQSGRHETHQVAEVAPALLAPHVDVCILTHRTCLASFADSRHPGSHLLLLRADSSRASLNSLEPSSQFSRSNKCSDDRRLLCSFRPPPVLAGTRSAPSENSAVRVPSISKCRGRRERDYY